MVLGLEVQKDSKHSSNKAEVFSTLVKDKKNHNSFLKGRVQTPNRKLVTLLGCVTQGLLSLHLHRVILNI